MIEALKLVPLASAEWLPLAKAGGIFLATFVLEDVAAVGAGLLLGAGGISWWLAFAACFLGIWMGDSALYALARYAGRGWFERSSPRRFGDKVARSERWFAERGVPALLFSRVVPGTRLPTYLAAGFLRVPWPRFLFVTGLASCVWTLCILSLAQLFGQKVAFWLGNYRYAAVCLVGAVVATILCLRWIRRACENSVARSWWSWLARWRHWEFWPPWMFYLPVAVYCVWLALKYRGLAVATAANPGMFSGGLVGESKLVTLKELFLTSPGFTVEAVAITGETAEARLHSLAEIRRRLGLEFPFILKPDTGQRGVGVKLIRCQEQAEAYLRGSCAPLIVQRYAPGPLEAGVFYYRFPEEPHGHVFAITEKIFPKVVGDGKSSLTELIRRDPRARFMAEKYLQRFARRRDEVLADGEELKLVEAGNHAQGCIFRDGMRLCTPELVARIDDISRRLTGFYIGRYDLRFASEEDLRAGRNFQIIELNGAASEATSIYDSRHSIFTAYRKLFQQWNLVFAVGAVNRRLGCAPTPLSLVWRKWREYTRMAAAYPVAD